MTVLPLLRAKERARLPADFIVTTKKPQWQCVLKSMPSLELVFVHIDFYTAFEQTTLQTQTAHYYYTQKFLDPLNRNFWKNLISINHFFFVRRIRRPDPRKHQSKARVFLCLADGLFLLWLRVGCCF
jgi:hypothetical protein